MRVTVDISLYPLREDFTPPIVDFVQRLRQEPGLEVLTNQLSTQLRGEHGELLAALGRCMVPTFAQPGTCVFVLKIVNADLPIATAPRLESRSPADA